MLLLHCSDAHADWVTSGVRRYDDVAEAFAQTVKTARQERVGLYLFTGDLTNPDDTPRALLALSLAMDVARELDASRIPSWWVSGNHDVIDDGLGRTTLSPLRVLSRRDWGVRVFDDGPAVAGLPGLDRSALLLPYPPATRPYDPRPHMRDPVIRRQLALVAGHLQVEGATPGDETTEMRRGRDVFFPFEECDPSWLLLGGHYHEGQTFERAGRRLHVPGSMVRLHHGEEKVRPRYLVWEVR